MKNENASDAEWAANVKDIEVSSHYALAYQAEMYFALRHFQESERNNSEKNWKVVVRKNTFE